MKNISNWTNKTKGSNYSFYSEAIWNISDQIKKKGQSI